MQFTDIRFIISAYANKQLPEDGRPEIAFAGRSNVGKSSLINALIGRKDLVKVSSRPGKTQALNFFLCNQSFYLVDLPGYGFARVNKNMQQDWQRLITGYLQERPSLRCVVVIFDLRHPAKEQDAQLLGWLRERNIPVLPVYTKADKLSGNERQQCARLLDAGHTIAADHRIIFSARTGLGRDQLLSALETFLDVPPLRSAD